MSAKVTKWKYEEVENLKNLLLEYPVVGIVNMEGMPAAQLQKIKRLLRENALIKMSKKSLMRHALEKASREERSLENLKEHVKGQPAFILSKINSFKLQKILEKNKANVPAKPNSIAPRDIIVQKGETPFPPGPVLGELQQVGIPTTVQGGKIAIKEDKVVARSGERISSMLAAALSRLGVAPVEVGLTLIATHEGGEIFLPEVLAVDEAKTISMLQEAYTKGVNLSINSGYITKGTAELAVYTAFNSALALAIEANVFEPGAIEKLLAKAHLQMLALRSLITPVNKSEVK